MSAEQLKEHKWKKFLAPHADRVKEFVRANGPGKPIPSIYNEETQEWRWVPRAEMRRRMKIINSKKGKK